MSIEDWFGCNEFKVNIYYLLDFSTRVSFTSTCKLYRTFRVCKRGRRYKSYLAHCSSDGNIKLIKWMSNKKNENWFPQMLRNAILNNRMSTLKFLLENNCPIDIDMCLRAIKKTDSVESLEMFITMGKMCISIVILNSFKLESKCGTFYKSLLDSK